MSDSLFLLKLEEAPVSYKLGHLRMWFRDFIMNGNQEDFSCPCSQLSSGAEGLDSLLFPQAPSLPPNLAAWEGSMYQVRPVRGRFSFEGFPVESPKTMTFNYEERRPFGPDHSKCFNQMHVVLVLFALPFSCPVRW